MQRARLSYDKMNISRANCRQINYAGINCVGNITQYFMARFICVFTQRCKGERLYNTPVIRRYDYPAKTGVTSLDDLEPYISLTISTSLTA